MLIDALFPMNAHSFKTVFSKRLGCLVAVGEHASNHGKGSGARPMAGGSEALATIWGRGFVGALTLGFGLVTLAWAQPAHNALPTGGQVAQGAVQFSQSSQQLTINQASDRAAVNWQSFDIGAAAQVNVVQPSNQSVLLNRVGGTEPSQIFGQLSANGRVILVNPNGMVFGQDGSVSAAAFTGSTLNMSDDDFMAGNERYARDAATGAIVNRGLIQAAPGGYVALLGASVSNEGRILAPQGNVYLAAADAVTFPAATLGVPLGRSGRIKLELTPASINAAVANQKGGTIVTEGGQVYLQAAAVNSAVASILQSGSIDTTGEQGGAVHVLADGGHIRADGRIQANSTGKDDNGQVRKGGDIVIGRDEETGALAKTMVADGAQLESLGGFVETSGDVLSTTGTRVKAAEWLLDPYNITIAATSPSGTVYASDYSSGADSVILASDIAANLDAGTSVTIATGAGGASAGDINVHASIAKSAGGDATLKLKAHNDIVLAANTTITSTQGKLNVVFNSDLDASGAGAIVMNTGSGINSLGGNITLGGGTTGDGTGHASGNGTFGHGISLSGATLSSGAGDVRLTAQSHTAGNTIYGIHLAGASTITTTSGHVDISGTGRTTGQYGYGMLITGGAKVITDTGHVTINAISSDVGSSDSVGIQIRTVGGVTSNIGNIAITGTSRGAAGQYNQGITFNSGGSLVAGSSGTVTLTGTSGSAGSLSAGVAGARVTTSGAAVVINATTLAAALGSVDLETGAATISTSGGNVTLVANSYLGSGSEVVNAGSGTVTLQNRTVGTLIDVGGTSADVLTGTLKLGISSAELGRITAANVVVGNNESLATGNVTVNAIDLGALGNTSGNLTVLGNHITVIDNVTKTAGTDATLSLQARGDISVAANKTITATTGKLNVVLNSDSDGDNVGSIAMNSGSGITSNGGNIRLSGGLYHDSDLSWTYGTATSPHGISLTGTELNAGGGNISLRGASMTGNYLGHGVGITGGSISTTGGGFIDIQGYATAEQGFSSGIAVLGANITGGSTGTTRLIGTNASNSNTNRQQGVWLNDAAGVTSLVTSTGGSVTVTGFGGGSSTGTNNFNYGVAVQNGLISSGGTGTVNVTGTGGTTTGINNAGVAFNGSNLSNGISSSGGVINVTGTGGAGGLSPGVWFVSGLNGSIQSGSNAAINLTTDSLVMDAGAINAGSGTVTLQNRTAGTLVNVGGADVLTGSPLTLGVSNAELARISAGSVVIGSTAQQTGNLTLSSAITTPNASQFTLVSNNTIAVNAAITNASATDQTLNLNAENGILQRANITATGAGPLNVVMNAKGLTDGVAVADMTAEQRALSHGIFVDAATINANGGDVTLNGTSYAADAGQTSGIGKGIQLHNTVNINARHISITGTADNLAGTTSRGVILQRYPSPSTLNATGNITITGTLQGAGSGSGIQTSESGWGAQAPMISAGGAFTLRANNRGAANNTAAAIDMRSGMQVRAVGDVLVQAETNNAAVNAINFNSRAATTWGIGGALDGNASFRSIDAGGVASGNVVIQSNQGGIRFNNLIDPTLTSGSLTALTAIVGRNVVIDNTGAGMGSGSIDPVTGVITRGTGTSASNQAGVHLADGRAITASNSINIFGASTTGSGVAISGASALSANTPGGTGDININGVNTSSNGAAINISHASSTINANNVVKLTSSGTGSGTSLVAAGNITMGGELQVENPAAGSISGVVGGTGMLRKVSGTGAGTLVLTGTNTYTGGTTADGGLLQVGNGGATGTLGVGGSVSIGATLAVNRSDAFAINQDISGVGNLRQIGAGTTVLTGTNTYDGTTTITAGSLQVGAGGTTGTLGVGAVSVSSGAALNFNRSDALTVANAISGAGTVSQNGSGAGTSSNLSLTGYLETSTGAFNVNHGTLTFNAAAASRKFNGSAININNGSTVRILSGTNLHYAFGTTWNFDSQGGGTIDASPQVNFVMGFGTTSQHNTFNSNGGVTNTIRGPHTGGINTNVAANVTTFNVAPGSSSVGLNVVADLWNSGTVTKTGAGLMQLTGQATGVYTGTINVTQGTLQVGDGGANGTLGSGAVNVSSGANVVMNRSDTVTVGNLISGAGSLTQAGTGTTILTGANTYSGTTTINSGHLHIGNGGGAGALGTGNVAIQHADSQLVFNRTGAITVANAISGVGRIVQRGTGSVKLSGDNSALSGGITLSRGSLMLGNGAGDTNKTAGTGTITMGDANTGANNITLEIESSHGSLGSNQIRLNRNIHVTQHGTGTATISGVKGAGSGTFTEIISSITLDRNVVLHDGNGERFGVSGALIGPGNITMTGTRISRSGSNISNDFTGSVTVNSGTTLQANAAQIFSTKTDLQVNGTLNLMGGASQSIDSLTGSGTISSWNAFTSNPATLSVGNDNGSGTFSGRINTPNVANPVVVSLEKNGTGTQILTGDNTYSGGTTINAGTLQVGNGGTTGTLGTGAVVDDAHLVINRSNSYTIANALSGTGRLSQVGSGTTVLGADNSYAGTTTISGGTLQVGNGGSTGTLGVGDVTLSNNATLSYVRSVDTTIANAITGAGSVSATITGTGSDLAVDRSISITGGTLNLAADGNLSVTQSIGTNNNSATALVLNAGAATSAGTATGGDITLSGSGGVSVGTGGRATLYTGSVAGSTGLGVNTGFNRYNSDEQNSRFTTALGSGTYAIYREAPSLSVRFNNASKTYDGQAFTGGNGLTVVSGWVNGDSNPQLGSISYSGASQNAVNAGSYVIGGTALSGLGYALAYTPGTLTVGKKDVTLSSVAAANKVYDGNNTASITSGAITTGIGTETLSVTGAGVFDNKNAGVGKTVTVADVTLLTKTNGTGDWANYNLTTTGSLSTTATIDRKMLTLSAASVSKTYDGSTAYITQQADLDHLSNQLLSGDIVTAASISYADKNAASGTKTITLDSVSLSDGNDGGNYDLTRAGNSNSTILKAALSKVIASKTYDGLSTVSAAQITAIEGVNGETFSATAGMADISDKNVAAANKTLTSLAGLSLASTNGGLASNYHLDSGLPVTGLLNNVSIDKATLTVTATAVTKTYDGTTSASGTGAVGALAGAAAGEVVDAAGSQAFLDKNAGSGKTVRASGVTIKDSANADVTANYDIGYVDNTASTIDKAALTKVTASKTYDGLATVSAAQMTSIEGVNGETFTATQGTADISDKNVATANKTITSLVHLSLSSANGGLANNYLLNVDLPSAGVHNAVSIASASATVTANATMVTYNGTTQLQSAPTSTGFIAGDNIAISGVASGQNAGNYTSNLVVGGNDASNYNVIISDADLVIGKAALTVTGNSLITSYNSQSQSVAGFTASGLQGTDTTADLVNVSASGASARNAGSYTNTVSAGTQANYELTLQNGTLQIDKAIASVSGTATEVVYNGATQTQTAPTSSGFIAGDDIIIGGAASGKNAGTYTSSLAVGGSDAGNYDITFTNANLVIDKANATVTANSDQMTYNGQTQNVSSFTASGLVGGETTAVLSGVTTTGGSGRNVGSYTHTASGTDGNYELSFVAGTLQIDKALVTAALVGQVTKEYDGTTTANNLTADHYSLSGWAAGEGATVTKTSGVYASPNVADNAGTGSVSTTLHSSDFVVTGSTDLNNYTLPVGVSGLVGTITRAPLTVKVNNTSMFVTHAPEAALDQGFSYTGLKNNESPGSVLGVLTRSYTGSTHPGAGIHAGVYGLSVVPGAANYSITVQNGDLNVAAADQLLIHIGNVSATYGTLTAVNAGAAASHVVAQYCLDASNCAGANIANLTMSQQGGRWMATDASNASISFNTTVDTTGHLSSGGFLNVGNYLLGAGSLSTTGTINFRGAVVNPGALTVDPKSLSLSANNVSKVYDGTTSLAGMPLTPSGVMAGDQISVSSSGGSFSDKNVGSRSFSLSGLQLQGADQANYSLASASVTGTGAITPKALVLSASALDKVYDATAAASVGGLTLAGVVQGDTVNAVGGTATFVDRHVARDGIGNVLAKSVSINGVSLSGADADNYSVDSQVGTTAKIMPLVLKPYVTAQDKVYDGVSLAQSRGHVAGALADDVVNLVTGQANFASKNVARDSNGQVISQEVAVEGLTLVGAGAGNYSLSSSGAMTSASITPKLLQASGAVADKVYDGTAQASLQGLEGSGVLQGDRVSVEAERASFTDQNVSRDALGNALNKTVTVSGLSISGPDAGNYVLQGGSFSAQAKILPKRLGIRAEVQGKVYDGTTLAQLLNLQLTGLVGVEQLEVSADANFRTPHVGMAKAVDVRYTLSDGAQGGLAMNYQLPTGLLTGNIRAVAGTTSIQPLILPDGWSWVVQPVRLPSAGSTGRVVSSSLGQWSETACAHQEVNLCQCQISEKSGQIVCEEEQ
jgi:filamentous hemagglutinin family protein